MSTPDYNRDDPKYRRITGDIGVIDNQTRETIDGIVRDTTLTADEKRTQIRTLYNFTEEQLDILVKE